MSDQHLELVRAGYDAMAARHLAWIDEIEGDPRPRFLDELDRRLDDDSAVVDLGCGGDATFLWVLAQTSTPAERA